MRVNEVTKYDDQIRAAAAEFLPFLEWGWLKAQLWQESRLNPIARSRRGASGVAQFMPPTWNIDVLQSKELALPRDARPTDPEHAIRAAAWYDAWLWKAWTAQRPDEDRRRLMFAAYNAGFGNMLRAQELADGSGFYAPIIKALERVTGIANATETRDYVIRIERWYHQIKRR